MSKEVIIQVATNVLLGILISGLAATVEFDRFTEQFKQKKGLLVGFCCQFLVMPLLGFVSVKAFDLRPTYAVTLLVATSSPGGSFSNWWCSIFNVDLALSVAMTTVSTLASIAMLPLNLFLYAKTFYGKGVALDWLDLIVTMVIVLAAICVGLYISARHAHRAQLMFRIGNMAGVALVTLGFMFSGGGNDPIWDREPSFYAAVAVPPISGAMIAFGVAVAVQMPRPGCVAVCIETCYQNTAIALTVALGTFKGDDQNDAAGLAIFYQIVQVVTLAIASFVAWKCNWTYAPADVTLLESIRGNFQPGVAGAGDKVDTGMEQVQGSPSRPEGNGTEDGQRFSNQQLQRQAESFAHSGVPGEVSTAASSPQIQSPNGELEGKDFDPSYDPHRNQQVLLPPLSSHPTASPTNESSSELGTHALETSVIESVTGSAVMEQASGFDLAPLPNMPKPSLSN